MFVDLLDNLKRLLEKIFFDVECFKVVEEVHGDVLTMLIF